MNSNPHPKLALVYQAAAALLAAGRATTAEQAASQAIQLYDACFVSLILPDVREEARPALEILVKQIEECTVCLKAIEEFGLPKGCKDSADLATRMQNGEACLPFSFFVRYVARLPNDSTRAAKSYRQIFAAEFRKLNGRTLTESELNQALNNAEGRLFKWEECTALRVSLDAFKSERRTAHATSMAKKKWGKSKNVVDTPKRDAAGRFLGDGRKNQPPAL